METELRSPSFGAPSDYAALAEVANVTQTPVLLNYSQHFALLEDLVSEAREAFWNVMIFIRFSGPYMLSLPKTLLVPDVFLGHDPHSWLSYVPASGPALLISDHFRRDTIERGDNSICCQAWGIDQDIFTAWFTRARVAAFLGSVTYGHLADEELHHAA